MPEHANYGEILATPISPPAHSSIPKYFKYALDAFICLRILQMKYAYYAFTGATEMITETTQAVTPATDIADAITTRDALIMQIVTLAMRIRQRQLAHVFVTYFGHVDSLHVHGGAADANYEDIRRPYWINDGVRLDEPFEQVIAGLRAISDRLQTVLDGGVVITSASLAGEGAVAA